MNPRRSIISVQVTREPPIQAKIPSAGTGHRSVEEDEENVYGAVSFPDPVRLAAPPSEERCVLLLLMLFLKPTLVRVVGSCHGRKSQRFSIPALGLGCGHRPGQRKGRSILPLKFTSSLICGTARCSNTGQVPGTESRQPPLPGNRTDTQPGIGYGKRSASPTAPGLCDGSGVYLSLWPATGERRVSYV